MKLGLQTFNVKKATTIKAKAEGKKNLPQKKSKPGVTTQSKPLTVKEELKPKQKPVFNEVVQEKRIDITDSSYLIISASQVDGDKDTYVDVRIYRKTDKYEGPTKKGIRLHVEFLEELIEGLVSLNEELESVGV